MIRQSSYCVFLILVSCASAPEPKADAIDTVLENGLQIQDVVVGTGDPVDSLAFITLHYTGYLSDSTIFENRAADNAPLTIQLTRQNVIEGWFEGIQGMRKGGIRTLVIPPSLAYGSIGINGVIPGNETLRFVIELHESHRPPQAWAFDESVLETSSDGIRFIIHQSGSGRMPIQGDVLKIHYSGYLIDGRIFDSSVYRGEAFQVIAGSGTLIPGWESTLMRMKPGERRTAFIPANLAFGEAGFAGRIPPNETLRFDIELLSVKSP